VVLFVSRAAIDPPLADRLAVEPGRIDLGTFKLAESGDGELSARVTLRGVSDRPVMVNSIMKSCGCTMSDWEGGVIRPGAETHMDVTVERTAWGAGSQRRELRLIFPDGSERRIEVVGEGVVDTRDAGLQVRTGSITFDVPTIGVEVPYRAVEPCLIASESSHSVETDSPWLRGTLGRRGEQVQLVAEIDLDERQLRELFAKCRLQGVLRVTDSAAGAVTKVDVSVIRSRVFEARPQTIFVKKSESPAARTAIVPVVDGVDAWRVSSVASEPSGLQLSLLEQSGSARVVECAATAETPLGVHVARCQIETGAPVPETVQFVVHVGE
jgi:hypothetical protein